MQGENSEFSPEEAGAGTDRASTGSGKGAGWRQGSGGMVHREDEAHGDTTETEGHEGWAHSHLGIRSTASAIGVRRGVWLGKIPNSC